MKKKYIFSMVAGLSVMAISSCSEKTASVEEAAKEAVTSAVEKTEEVASAAAESPSAYYVMFKGDGG